METARVDRLIADLHAAADGSHAPAATIKLYDTLVASEYILLEAYADSAPAASVPSGDMKGGSIDLGPVLHYLHHPPFELKLLVDAIVGVLELHEGAPLPSTHIDDALWSEMVATAEGPGIVAGDGTIYGTSQYEQLDFRWILAVAEFVAHVASGSKAGPGPQVPPIPLEPQAGRSSIRIGIVGDWGTGTYGSDGGPAPDVISGLVATDPDYVIHLGDVYYAGTDEEEVDNLLSLWPSTLGDQRSFTLNSNHEMYDGGHGYFDKALTAPAFRAQQGANYFALEFGVWVVLCLDSAYDAPIDDMYMEGRLGSDQIEWIRKCAPSWKGRKIIAMSHHTGVTTDGSRTTGLWRDLTDALGRDPDYWYWGHVHNGIVYTEKSAAGAVRARCAGHGAIPFGRGWALVGADGDLIPEVCYVAHTPIPDTNRVRNGFAVIELTEDTIAETFYETTSTFGHPRPMWPTGD